MLLRVSCMLVAQFLFRASNISIAAVLGSEVVFRYLEPALRRFLEVFASMYSLPRTLRASVAIFAATTLLTVSAWAAPAKPQIQVTGM
jgi:hypothetical protein